MVISNNICTFANVIRKEQITRARVKLWSIVDNTALAFLLILYNFNKNELTLGLMNFNIKNLALSIYFCTFAIVNKKHS